MRGFRGDGADPLVGEIRAIRRFEIGDDGWLFPLVASTGPWTDGVNTATCLRNRSHRAPETACTCGWYAYHSERSLRGGAVSAVVSMWGQAVIGSRGLRAEYARVDAVCLPPDVPADVRRRLGEHYPVADVFDDPQAMVAGHPLTGAPGRRRLPEVSPASEDLITAIRVLAAAAVLTLPFAGLTGSATATRVVLWWLAAVLAVTSVAFARSPRTTWRRMFVVAPSTVAWLIVLPSVLASASAVRTGVGVVILPIGLVTVIRHLRRERRPPTQVLPNAAIRDALAPFVASDWEVTRTARRFGAVTVDSRSGTAAVTVRHVSYRPAATNPLRHPTQILGLLAGMAALGRRATIAVVLDEGVASGWVEVHSGFRLGIIGPARMTADEFARTLALPAQSIGAQG